MHRQYDKAIAAAQRAIEVNPNSADAIYLKSRIFMNAGRPEGSRPPIINLTFEKTIKTSFFTTVTTLGTQLDLTNHELQI